MKYERWLFSTAVRILPENESVVVLQITFCSRTSYYHSSPLCRIRYHCPLVPLFFVWLLGFARGTAPDALIDLVWFDRGAKDQEHSDKKRQRATKRQRPSAVDLKWTSRQSARLQPIAYYGQYNSWFSVTCSSGSIRKRKLMKMQTMSDGRFSGSRRCHNFSFGRTN